MRALSDSIKEDENYRNLIQRSNKNAYILVEKHKKWHMGNRRTDGKIVLSSHPFVCFPCAIFCVFQPVCMHFCVKTNTVWNYLYGDAASVGTGISWSKGNTLYRSSVMSWCVLYCIVLQNATSSNWKLKIQ